MKEALFYETIKDHMLRCTLCPRYCRLKPGQHGFCYVRKNIDGKLYTLAYGKPYAVNVDPIEKKPLFHFLPGSKILSIGTAGCNMACKFCQNWDISKAKYDQTRAIDLPPERLVQLSFHYNARGIAYTYNEPTIFAEYAMDTAELARANNLKNIMVTNGYISPGAIPQVYKNIDGANVDLKAFSEDFYYKMTLSHLQPVLETLQLLKRRNVWIEITNLIIPTLNDNIDEIRRMSEWILNNLGAETPLHFTAFHPDYKLTSIPPTMPSILLKAREEAQEVGLRYVYVGNVLNEEASSTYCHRCGALLIRRNWYTTSIVNLKNGKCTKCGEKLAGIFDEQ